MPFHHNNRTIFALTYELATPPPALRELVVWLNDDGTAENPRIQPCEPNTRIVTTKPGQEILVGGVREKVIGVKVFREVGNPGP